MNKAVIDTNVFISSLISKNPASSPSQVISSIDVRFRPVFSRETFYELERKLFHKKFEKYFQRENLLMFLEELKDLAFWVSIPNTLNICRDIEDNKILETALVSQSDAIITGDKDLLVLADDFPIMIISPRAFVDEFIN